MSRIMQRAPIMTLTAGILPPLFPFGIDTIYFGVIFPQVKGWGNEKPGTCARSPDCAVPEESLYGRFPKIIFAGL
jgi:hypothetical protein